MMHPIRTLERLPEDAIEVWWFNQYSSSWCLGHAMLLDFEGNANLYYEYTYWLPADSIICPKDVEYEEDDIEIV